jgi:hypothetical protein
MLFELRNTRQIAGELPRKWYFSQDLDLVVWFDIAGVPCAFQLAYGEQSISWHFEKGYKHYVVDNSGWFATPLLREGGRFKKDKVIKQFIALSSELPLAVTELVANKLREFNESIYSDQLGCGDASKSAPQMVFESEGCGVKFDPNGCPLAPRPAISSDMQVPWHESTNPPFQRQRKRTWKLSPEVIFILIFAIAVTTFTALYS